MSFLLTIEPEAEADIDDAKRWYERQRKGLGDDFLLCIEEALQRIRRQPDLYTVVYNNVCRSAVRRFPYGIFFRMEQQNVVVVGDFHGRRNPRTWKDRS